MLGRIFVQGFEPMTGQSSDDVERKIALRNEITKTEQDLEGLKQKCRGTRSLIVVFYLYSGDTNPTRHTKDLDNLLKIVLDVLPDYMDKNETKSGLELFENDTLIHEVYAIKKLVSEESKEGISIEMYGSNILEEILFRVSLLMKR